MAPRSTPLCDHELRPGITVCLRCQHAERAAKRAHQRQMMARGTTAALVLGLIAAIGVAGATAIRGNGGMRSTYTLASGAGPQAAAGADSAPDSTATPTADSETAVRDPDRTVGTVAGSTEASASASPRTVVGVAGPGVDGAAVAVRPVVPVGRTALRDTMVADRAGDTVRVSFDLELSRTRRPEKFEAIIRSTLPQVYGTAVDSALRALPAGAVARAGDLVTTLPEQGFHIRLPGGRTIAVWPETRAGRDGPLVVAYRAVASP